MFFMTTVMLLFRWQQNMAVLLLFMYRGKEYKNTVESMLLLLRIGLVFHDSSCSWGFSLCVMMQMKTNLVA